MRGNLSLNFSAQEFAMNEGEIIGMNMDLFGEWWKSSNIDHGDGCTTLNLLTLI